MTYGEKMIIENNELKALKIIEQDLIKKGNNGQELKDVQAKIREINNTYLKQNLNIIDRTIEKTEVKTIEQKEEVIVETELDNVKRELKLANKEYDEAVDENQNIYKVLLPASRKRKIDALNKVKELREKKKQIMNNDVLSSSQDKDNKDTKGEQSPSSILNNGE